jgi:hypothetical protein
MNLTTTAKFDKVKHSTESILYGVNFGPLLIPPPPGVSPPAAELLTGAPTVAIAPVTVPPLANTVPIVNLAAFVDDDGNTVAIGQGVQVRISAGVSPTDYTLTVSCGTSQGNLRTIVCTLQVRDG